MELELVTKNPQGKTAKNKHENIAFENYALNIQVC